MALWLAPLPGEQGARGGERGGGGGGGGGGPKKGIFVIAIAAADVCAEDQQQLQGQPLYKVCLLAVL